MGRGLASRRASLVFLSAASAFAFAAHAGCGSSGGPGETGGGDDDGGVGLDGTFSNDSPVFNQPDTSGNCSASNPCSGGQTCIPSTGQCCDPTAVCNSTCCGGGQVCLFDQCVTPGGPCHSGNDCPNGQYCETGLGSSDAGSGSMEAGCTAPLPIGGRCLPLPPTCADGGASGPDAGCISDCEYHPPTGGPLNAVAKWTWGAPDAGIFSPSFTDVWSTPTIARIHDDNCDGVVDELDPPNIVFVSGDDRTDAGVGNCCQCNSTERNSCHTGVLRMLDGNTGAEVWSLASAGAGSPGFMGMSNAVGDVDGDGYLDIVAISGDGYVVMVDRNGTVQRKSDKVVPGSAGIQFGWGGGLAIADMDLDGFPEITYGATVFTTTNNTITLKFTGTDGTGGGADEETSLIADVDGAPDGHLELVAGNTAYRADGTVLWQNTTVPDGFNAVGDFDKNGTPEVVDVANGKVWLLDGATGTIVLGPATLPGTGSGGAPTVADFDGDGYPEIGVAMATFYSVMKPYFAADAGGPQSDAGMPGIDVLWKTKNHDLSSSVTGSTVFDFEGDGKAEVIYADECFLWVFDGQDGSVRFAAPHTSFTATEASLLADVNGDGHAEMLMVSNATDPRPTGSWPCMEVPDAGGAAVPITMNGQTWAPGPWADGAYRGIVMYGDSADSWVGTRTIWNEHTYHVTNVCDDRDTACASPDKYGSIPKGETKNWLLPWLNDYRQNVQDKGIFNAPDAIVSLTVACTSPINAQVSVRNIGQAGLPSGVNVGIFQASDNAQVGAVTTTQALLPGQTQTLPTQLTGNQTAFYAKIIINPSNPTFHECNENNDTSAQATITCIK